jgi:hypothetical protein
LPDGVTVEPVPLLPLGRKELLIHSSIGTPLFTWNNTAWIGTTWYERRLSYWIRRAAWTLVTGALLAVWTVIIGSLLFTLFKPYTGLFYTALAVEIVMTLGMVLVCVAIAKFEGARIARGGGRWQARPVKVTVGSVARALGGLIVLMPVMAVVGAGFFATIGVPLALFLMSLMPVPYSEQGARCRIAAALAREQH